MKKSLKTILVFLGGFIGTLTAIKINGGFWWLGLLVGGLLGYLFCDFEGVIRTIPKAWKTVVRTILNKEYWISLMLVFRNVFSIVLTIGAIFILSLILFVKSSIKLAIPDWILFVVLSFFLALMITLCSMVSNSVKETKELAKETKIFFWHFNPISFFLWYGPKYLFQGIFWIIIRIPKFIWRGIVIITRFIKTLFVLIHSEERLLYGIDVAIGVAIGYFTFKNGVFALPAMMIGGIIGVGWAKLNHELLSKRILRKYILAYQGHKALKKAKTT